MSERLPPIPTPPTHLWRQIRSQYLPAIVFAVALVAAIILWVHWVAPPTLVGEAEAAHADVRAPHLGTLSDLKVELFQTVKAGQEIGHVAAADPRMLEASLAVQRAEIDLIRTTMDPVVSQQRMLLDFERLQLDWMSERVKLASLKAQLDLAEANLARSEPLHRNKLLTDERFDEVKTARDRLKAQVDAQSELVTGIGPGLKNYSAGAASGTAPSPVEGLRAAIKLQEEKLRLTEVQFGAVPLISPIDGVVTVVHRRVGETVTAGEPLLQIASTHVDRIVGFVRPPLNVELKPGMTAEVRTRTFHRMRATGKLVGVGTQFEPILPTLLAAMHLPISKPETEVGLQVSFTVPPGFPVRPGEHVDIILHD